MQGTTESTQGFAIDFVFEPNEFFSDTILTKTYYLENPTNAGYDDLVYDRSKGSAPAYRPCDQRSRPVVGISRKRRLRCVRSDDSISDLQMHHCVEAGQEPDRRDQNQEAAS